MSVENVEKFYGLLMEDKALMEKITSAGKELNIGAKTAEELQEKGLAEVHAMLQSFAQEAGCPFTLEELSTYAARPQLLSDNELDAVVGGGVCVCVVGGGGGEGGRDYKCICVVTGTGGGADKDGFLVLGRCVCVIGGGGNAW